MASAEEKSGSPSVRSLRGLDGANFLQVDVSPYLSVYLKGAQHWGAGAIGLAMAANSVAVAVFQIPAGMLVDQGRKKRLLLALAGVLAAVASLIFGVWPKMVPVVLAQISLGASSALAGPALAALSLGIVGRKLLAPRISRNGVFNHAGNLVAAVLAGLIGQRFGYRWIFALGFLFALGNVVVAPLIQAEDIDHESARGQTDQEPIAVPEMLKNRKLLAFLASVLLFHFGNAAMLPLAGQVLSEKHPESDRLALSGCVIVAQLAMMGVSWVVGRFLERKVSHKKIFLLAMLVVPLRGILFALFSNPYAVVTIQLLDGVAAGIFGVVTVVMVAELMHGTGRFNLAQGLMALCVGVGDALSNSCSGLVVQHYGYPAGFHFLSAVAVIALLVGWATIPHTHSVSPEDEDESP